MSESGMLSDASRKHRLSHGNLLDILCPEEYCPCGASLFFVKIKGSVASGPTPRHLFLRFDDFIVQLYQNIARSSELFSPFYSKNNCREQSDKRRKWITRGIDHQQPGKPIKSFSTEDVDG